MAGKRSAGVLLYRRAGCGLEVLIAHMGGPLWAHKENSAWSVPKGEPEPAEELADAARREFAEELGLPAPDGELVPLGELRQRSGKVVTIWAAEGDLDVQRIVPGTFPMEWPPRSGHIQHFPEIDRAAWCTLDEARPRLVAGQRPFLDRLAERLG